MGGTRNMCGGDEKRVQNLNPKNLDHM